MIVEFECCTDVPAGVQEAFDRSRSIDLHMTFMSASRERAIAGVTAGLISDGEEVTWRAGHFGVPIRMTSRITAMTEPEYFVDEQVRGAGADLPRRRGRQARAAEEAAGRVSSGSCTRRRTRAGSWTRPSTSSPAGASA